MAKRTPHTVNGRFYGMFYETDSGTLVYLAHRKADQIYRAKYAWCIDTSTLERCRSLGIKAVGVIRQDSKGKYIWLTWLEDFFTHPASFSHVGETRQRGLPLTRFRIDPAKSLKAIEKALKIR